MRFPKTNCALLSPLTPRPAFALGISFRVGIDLISSTSRTNGWGDKHHKVTLGQKV